MKEFKFRLQAVLTLREQAEQAAQQHCARAFSVVSAATERLRAAEVAIAASDESRRAQLSAGAPADQIEHLRAFGVILNERRTQRLRELAEARAKAEEATRLLVIATQAREALDHLRERQLAEYNYETAQTEQKMLDEISAQKRPLLEAWREPAPAL